MIAPETITSYAQYNEDIILAALLHDTDKGFYVDVGANHEEYHSVTKYFYENGWSGINIEPNKNLIGEFTRKRKRDINLAIGISNKSGNLKLREYPEHDGLSTLSEESKKELADKNLPHTDYEIKVETLSDIFDRYEVKGIDFLKIDVEGYEHEVIEGNNWSKYKPRIVCIEANHRNLDWSKVFQDNGYKKFIFDGLNEYYIESGAINLTKGFAERAALLAHNSIRHHHLQMWEKDLADIKQLRIFSQEQNNYINGLKHENQVLKTEIEHLNSLTLSGKSPGERARLVARSVAGDYRRYRKGKKKQSPTS